MKLFEGECKECGQRKIVNEQFLCGSCTPEFLMEKPESVATVLCSDRVMPDVVLEEIKKYKYECSNPYCRRWNELAYMEHAKVVCEFCGIIAKTRK